MPQIIEVPGMGRVEFPDGMGDAEIEKAIQRSMPQIDRQTAKPGNIGVFEAGKLAAGKTTDNILDGLTQMYLGARGESSALNALKQTNEEKNASFKPVQDAHPIATGIGSALPMMALPVGGASAFGMIGKSAIAGALPEATSYGTTEERIKRAAVGAAGGAVGAGIGLGIAKIMKPSGATVDGLSKEALSAADRLGYKLTAGQRTQNPAMQNFENYLSKSPGSSGAMQARSTANQSALNAAGAKSMGQTSGDLSEGSFAAAKNAIGAEFQRLQSITSPQLDTDFFSALAKIDADNAARGSFKSKSIDSLIDKGLDLAAKNQLSGKAYKEIRTQISNDAQSAFQGGDATLGQALKTVRKALDDAAKKSLTEVDQKAWDATREQWGAYKALTQSNVAEAGNLSSARLASVMRRQGDGLRTGSMQGPLSDVARVGEAVKSVQNPNSGQLINQMIYGNPISGLPMMAANKASEMAYMSPAMQAYFSRGLIDVGPKTRLLLGKGMAPVGAPLVGGLLGAQ